MILYTVVPEEFVLAGLDYGSGAGSTGPVWGSAPVEVVASGASGPVRLILEAGPGGGWRVSRLISSDPADYLDPSFAPGQAVPDPRSRGPALAVAFGPVPARLR